MAKRVVFLTIHGMGDTRKNYHADLVEGLRDRMGSDAWSEVQFCSVFYSDVFQKAQEKLFKRVERKVDSKRLRRFLLYGFADAGGLEHSRTIKNSAYKKVQKIIFDEMGKAYAGLDDKSGPVVVIAQSLGCQVLSNYIWDAQHHAKRPPGIWDSAHGNLSANELNFRKFKSLRVLTTTGCNIPIFVGGLPRSEIVPIEAPNNNFIWENYYDEDDPLGWPLQALSDKYKVLVRDIDVNVGGIFTSWTPFSHSKYWGDGDVQEPLSDHLLSLLG